MSIVVLVSVVWIPVCRPPEVVVHQCFMAVKIPRVDLIELLTLLSSHLQYCDDPSTQERLLLLGNLK